MDWDDSERVAARRRLSTAAAALWNEKATAGERLAAVGELYALFSELTQVGDAFDQSPEHDAATELAQGTAISPKDAARCLLDLHRTTQFLRGIEAALREAQRRFPGQTLELLYAGCGPYATLAVPLCLRFSPAEVQLTLIDFHERSLRAAKSLLARLGFSDFLRAAVQCDAATYRHPAERAPHLIVAESLQRALSKEPQLAITANLAPQLRAGGIFIPRRISIQLCLADLSKEFTLLAAGSGSSAPLPLARDRVDLGTVLELTAARAPDLLRAAGGTGASGASALPAVRVSIPELRPQSSYRAMLLTAIEVFDAFALGDYDSGITQPHIFHELGTLRGGEILELRYHLGPRPGFQVNRIAP